MISISLLWARKVTATFEKGARTRRPDGTFKIANGKVLLHVWRQRSRLESQSNPPPPPPPRQLGFLIWSQLFKGWIALHPPDKSLSSG